MDDKDLSIAVVLPRYGTSLGGGAETLAKNLVDDYLARSKPGTRVEVWTTCAMDHRTWQNAVPPGTDQVDGVTVRRFEVDKRDLEVFIRYEHLMAEGKALSPSEQLQWLSESVNSKTLYSHIAAHGSEFDLILFAPYLFATSFWGALIYPERSVLIPCLHNEHYAYQDVFKYAFNKVRGIIFNAEAERDLARQLYRLPNLEKKSAVVGMTFDVAAHEESPGADVAAFVKSESPYLLYSGRKEQGKNVGLLLDMFRKAHKIHPQLQLCLIGSGDLDFYGDLPKGVTDLGFVTEDEKRFIMRHAIALCQPSTNESFSIVLMEAWQQDTAVIVHANCAVTREHVVESGGGLYFASDIEFLAVVEKLMETGVAAELGSAGKSYVETVYSREAVQSRFVEALNRFASPINAAQETCSFVENAE